MGEGILLTLHSLLLSNEHLPECSMLLFVWSFNNLHACHITTEVMFILKDKELFSLEDTKAAWIFFILPSQLVSGKTLNLGLHLLDSTFPLRLLFHNFIFWGSNIKETGSSIS